MSFKYDQENQLVMLATTIKIYHYQSIDRFQAIEFSPQFVLSHVVSNVSKQANHNSQIPFSNHRKGTIIPAYLCQITNSRI